MLIYIMKSTACLAILLLFYKLFLEKENMHVFKRFYLLGSLLFSLIVPTIVFSEYVVVEPQVYEVTAQSAMVESSTNIPRALESDVNDIAPLLWIVYFLGMFFFGMKFLRNLLQIFLRIRRNPKYKNSSFIQVLLQEKIPPHTFFKYIFLNKTKFESKEIPKEVLLHEETHAREKHSVDVVIIELLQVLFWFNPLIYFFKKAIKLNHEFLADSAVLNKDIDPVTYQNTLLSFLSSESAKKYQPTLPNAINYSSIKKRFTVMKSRTSKKSIVFRSFLLLPLLALLLVGFTETKPIPIENGNSIQEEVLSNQRATPEMVATYNELAQKYNVIALEKRIIPLKDLKILETIYRKMSDKQKQNARPFPECLPRGVQEGATNEQVAEYNALAEKYNDMIEEEENIWLRKNDVERLEYLHSLMTEEQKADAEPFPDFPEPPEPPEPPLAPEEMEEEIIEMEQQEVLMREQAKAMEEQERAMEQQEQAMEVQEIEMGRQERRIEENKYLLKGRDKSYGSDGIPFGAFNVPRGSVRVTAGGRPLQEGIDYTVNYKAGTVQVLDPSLKASKTSIDISIENTAPKSDVSISPPPPPPAPKSPLDHVIEMAKKDATFYYEGKEITSDKAIEILKKNKSINIETKHINEKRPDVRLSTAPIVVEN